MMHTRAVIYATVFLKPTDVTSHSGSVLIRVRFTPVYSFKKATTPRLFYTGITIKWLLYVKDIQGLRLVSENTGCYKLSDHNLFAGLAEQQCKTEMEIKWGWN